MLQKKHNNKTADVHYEDKKNRIEANLVTGAVRQKVKQAFLLSESRPSAARKQCTALT